MLPAQFPKYATFVRFSVSLVFAFESYQRRYTTDRKNGFPVSNFRLPGSLLGGGEWCINEVSRHTP